MYAFIAQIERLCENTYKRLINVGRVNKTDVFSIYGAWRRVSAFGRSPARRRGTSWQLSRRRSCGQWWIPWAICFTTSECLIRSCRTARRLKTIPWWSNIEQLVRKSSKCLSSRLSIPSRLSIVSPRVRPLILRFPRFRRVLTISDRNFNRSRRSSLFDQQIWTFRQICNIHSANLVEFTFPNENP